MRTIMLAGALAFISLLGTEPGFARYEGPWCMHESLGRDTIISRCDMRSYEMCRAEMGARGGTYCTENPYYWARANAPRPPKKYKRTRAYRY